MIGVKSRGGKSHTAPFPKDEGLSLWVMCPGPSRERILWALEGDSAQPGTTTEGISLSNTVPSLPGKGSCTAGHDWRASSSDTKD